jgi:hypothetical protein
MLGDAQLHEKQVFPVACIPYDLAFSNLETTTALTSKTVATLFFQMIVS